MVFSNYLQTPQNRITFGTLDYCFVGGRRIKYRFFSFDIYSKIFMQNVMNSSMSALEV